MFSLDREYICGISSKLFWIIAKWHFKQVALFYQKPMNRALSKILHVYQGSFSVFWSILEKSECLAKCVPNALQKKHAKSNVWFWMYCNLISIIVRSRAISVNYLHSNFFWFSREQILYVIFDNNS